LLQRDYRFSRKQIREATGWSDGQLKIHCKRLEDMEYLLVHRGGRGQSMEYELLYTGNVEDERPSLMGLIDVNHMRHNAYDEKKSGPAPKKTGSSQGQVSPKTGGSQPVKTQKNSEKNSAHSQDGEDEEENSASCYASSPPSYRSNAASTLAALSLSAAED
jgi:hypothetical protein